MTPPRYDDDSVSRPDQFLRIGGLRTIDLGQSIPIGGHVVHAGRRRLNVPMAVKRRPGVLLPLSAAVRGLVVALAVGYGLACTVSLTALGILIHAGVLQIVPAGHP